MLEAFLSHYLTEITQIIETAVGLIGTQNCHVYQHRALPVGQSQILQSTLPRRVFSRRCMSGYATGERCRVGGYTGYAVNSTQEYKLRLNSCAHQLGV